MLNPGERQRYAAIQSLPKRDRPIQICIPRCRDGIEVACTKEGGVCSLRLYERRASGDVTIADDALGTLRTTCPARFEEGDLVRRWIGETLLDHLEPDVVGEVGFLQRELLDSPEDSSEDSSDVGREDVARIDSVLIRPGSDPLRWCALEIQAVYFSGAAMGTEFTAIRNASGTGIPFPAANRRPDYRSSGPKRLMPQLQTKVPALRRWGKKMAVLVDEAFFASLGTMDNVKDVSNCDIAWFIVGFDETSGDPRLVPRGVRLTTLERAVEGLTGGRPVSLGVFEDRIRTKLARDLHRVQPRQIAPDKEL